MEKLDFDKAIKDIEYIKLAQNITNRYSSYLTEDEIRLCVNHALEECLLKYDGSTKLSTYFSNWIRWTCLDFIKGKLRHSCVKSVPNIDLVIYNNPDHNISDVIFLLNESEQNILNKYYYEGYTDKEIASLLKTTPYRVRKIKNRALERLRELLE